MAEIVGIFAASHAPPLVRDWDAIERVRKDGLAEAFAELGRRIMAARPDVIVAIGADHWANFFLENMPAICIGVGERHDGPPEVWLSDYPHRDMVGHPELAMHLATSAFAANFEPSLSYRLKLDHAFCVPLWKAALNPLPPIVPVIVNALQAPLPMVARCLAFGEVLARAIEAFAGTERVVLLATGGLSHSVGEPQMGMIDEAFDRKALALLAQGDTDALIAYLTDARMDEAGNGAAEIRFWMTAHGAAGAQGFELIHYEAVAETYTGCGFAEWRLASGGQV